MKKLLIAFLAVALVPSFASAAAPRASQAPAAAPTNLSPEQDVGDGCGLGWQVTQSRTFLATTTRATTNATVPPTFGMTSGTLGCVQHSFAKNEVEAVSYAVANYDALSIEMASGQGETLAAFARTLGCDAASSAALGNVTQSRYNSIGGQSGIEMYRNVKAELASNSALRCGV
jgi:opacity protein-like surface antigen